MASLSAWSHLLEMSAARLGSGPSNYFRCVLRIRALRSARAIEAGPLAGLDEAGPVEGVLAAVPFQHRELGLPQRVSAAETGAKRGVVRHHRFPRDGIADRPEAHDQRFGPGQHERAAKAVDAFAVARSEEHTSELQSLRHLVCR